MVAHPHTFVSRLGVASLGLLAASGLAVGGAAAASIPAHVVDSPCSYGPSGSCVTGVGLPGVFKNVPGSFSKVVTRDDLANGKGTATAALGSGPDTVKLAATVVGHDFSVPVVVAFTKGSVKSVTPVQFPGVKRSQPPIAQFGVSFVHGNHAVKPKKNVTMVVKDPQLRHGDVAWTWNPGRGHFLRRGPAFAVIRKGQAIFHLPTTEQVVITGPVSPHK